MLPILFMPPSCHEHFYLIILKYDEPIHSILPLFLKPQQPLFYMDLNYFNNFELGTFIRFGEIGQVN